MVAALYGAGKVIESWRWFGSNDVVPLNAITQAGAKGVVSALHHIPYGEVWSLEEILKRKAEIEGNKSLNLQWNVVESLPLHENFKLGEGNLKQLTDNYCASMRNLAAAGLKTICYNFMPVIDWTRTTLTHPLPGGGRTLRFERHQFAAFDCFMLERKGAETEYDEDILRRAKAWFAAASQTQKDDILSCIMAGLPGAFERYDIPALKKMLAKYNGITPDDFRAHLITFLKAIIPLAQELEMNFCIHPDDPPRSLMGLPRIVSCLADLEALFEAVPTVNNGLTLCSGSLGASALNNVPEIARKFAERIHFAHLRNVRKDPDGSFMEAAHLVGDTDMVEVIDVLLAEQTKRKLQGRSDWHIPMRPDHGHELLDDINKGSFPGYSAIGRLKGLAELRGVMMTLAKVKGYSL